MSISTRIDIIYGLQIKPPINKYRTYKEYSGCFGGLNLRTVLHYLALMILMECLMNIKRWWLIGAIHRDYAKDCLQETIDESETRRGLVFGG